MSPLEAEFPLELTEDSQSDDTKMPVSAGGAWQSTYSAASRPGLKHSKSSNSVTRQPLPSNSHSSVGVPNPLSSGYRSVSHQQQQQQPSMAVSSASTSASASASNVFSWDRLKIREWLDSIRCGSYIYMFEEHHITGEVLLDCDDDILREIGVKKVGDRIRISQSIRSMRTKTIAAATSVLQSDKHSVSSSAKSHKALEHLNQLIVSPFDKDSNSGSKQPSKRPAIANAKSQTVTVDNHSSNVKELLSMDVVKQNTVKFIYSQGQSKTVNVGDCRDAEDIKLQALKKNAYTDESPANWCVHVADNELGTNTRKLSGKELVTICRSSDRLERKRLILCQNGVSPTLKQLSKSQQILRDTLSGDSIDRGSISSKGSMSSNSMFSEVSAVHGLHSSPVNQRQSGFSVDDDETGTVFPERLKKATSRAFGMQRPPSELISSNLADFFPDTTPQVLKETVRASRRFSKRVSRLSRISSRLSVSSSFGIPEAEESIPPVPPLPENGLSSGSSSDLSNGSTVTKNSMTNRKSSVGAKWNDISDNTNLISSIARRISTSSSTKSARSAARKSSTSATLSVASNEEAEEEEEDDEDLENENWGELLDTIRREESCPTKWIKGNFIGSGSFGQVYLGMNSITGELMAIKQVELPTMSDKGDESRKKAMIDALHREMSLLQVLHHPHIVQYFGSNSDKTHLNIFLEYVPGGSVSTMLANYGTFEPSLVRSFVRQILDGLDYLHKQNIIHRDIKGANILVDNKGSVKISDFGISKKIEAEFLTSNRVSLQGSVFWMAPEVVKQTSYTSKADIWSLGCLIIEMLTGSHPFPEFSQMQAIFRLGNSGSPTIPDEIAPAAKDFLQQTFQIDYNKRPTAGELLEHDFIKKEPI